MTVTNQGDVAISGTKIYEAKSGVSAFISRMMFNNTSSIDYVVEVKKYDYSARKLTRLFRFELLADYVFEDTGVYMLSPNDYLIATTDVAGTVFILEGNDQSI